MPVGNDPSPIKSVSFFLSHWKNTHLLSIMLKNQCRLLRKVNALLPHHICNSFICVHVIFLSKLKGIYTKEESPAHCCCCFKQCCFLSLLPWLECMALWWGAILPAILALPQYSCVLDVGKITSPGSSLNLLLSQLFSSCKTARLRSDRGFYFSSQMQKCSCFSSLAAERVGGESLWESLSKHCHTTQSLTATYKVLDMTGRFTVASGVMEALLFCRC